MSTSSITHIPTLGADGWVVESKKKADLILTNFFLANKSQSITYDGMISSAAYVIAMGQNKMQKTKEEMAHQLQDLFLRYYSAVEVVCDIREDVDSTSKMILDIAVVFTDHLGITYSLDKTIRTINGKFEKFITLNN